VPEINIEHHFLDKLKGRVRVAKEIDTLQHRGTKAKHERKWMRATAEALDIDLDSDYRSEYVPSFSFITSFPRLTSSSDDRAGLTRQVNKAHDVKLGQLKAELRELLRQPLVARGVSTGYVTSGSRPIAHDILAGECGWIHLPTPLYLPDDSRQTTRA